MYKMEKTKTYTSFIRYCAVCQQEVDQCHRCATDLGDLKVIYCSNNCDHYCGDCYNKRIEWE